MVAAASAVSLCAADGVPFFNACVSDPPQSAGMYRFSTGEYAPEQIKRNIYASGGGIADDNYYYGVRYEMIGGLPVIECASYSLRTWGVEDLFSNCKITNVATDLAYYAPKDEAYGCFFNETGTGYVFGKCRLSQFSCDKIADLETAFAAMDFDAEGTLYAIDWQGRLNIVDTATGAQTLVGDTGKTTELITGGAIDRKTGTFYFSVKTSQESALYAVNLTTAEATKVYDLENGEQLGGMYFPETYDNAAPAASGNPSVSFNGTALAGTVRFRAPQKTVGGDILSGAVTYHIEANGEEVATGSASYSDGYINANVTLDTPGKYCFSLYFSNEAGRGPRSKASQYVGPDIPRSPASPRLTYKDGTVKLFWTAAGSTGVNGGNIDRTGMYYKITRMPDGEVFTAEASGWSQQLDMPATRTTYYYEIKTVAGGLESEGALTPEFSLGPVVPPFTEDFPALTSTIGWKWLNNDSYVDDNYSVSSGMRLVTMGAPEEGAFLVTPPMVLSAGAKYDISIALKRGNTRYNEEFSLVAGTAPTAEGLGEITIIDATPLEADDFTTFTGTLQPTASGTYYIALRGTSPDGRMLYMKSFDISKGVVAGAPGEVTELTAEADMTGAKKVTVRFKAPTVNLEGGELAELTSAELLRDNQPVKTITEGVAPGAELLIVDDTEPSVGYHVYTVVCHNSAGNGVPVSVKVWVGFNVPEPVEWVKVLETSTPGTVDVSWAPATMDIDGKPLGDTPVTYTVYDRSGEIVKAGLQETSFTIRAVEPLSPQSWVQYRVGAVSEGGMSELAKSILVPVGKPDSAPWLESWANKETSHLIGSTQNCVGDTWMVVGGFSYNGRDIEPQDNDGGMMGMENTVPDETISLFTGKIDLSTLSAPALSFWVYNYIGDNGKDNANELAVKIWGDNDEEFMPLQTIVIGETGPARQWNKVIVPLTGYDGQTVRLRLEATVITAIYIHLDNMEVNTSSPCNLTASDIIAPASVNPDEEFAVSFTVSNTGDASIDGAKAILLRDGETVAEKSLTTLQSGTRRTVTFTEKLGVVAPDEVVYICKVEAPGDLIASDDETPGAAVKVRHNGNPAVSGLTATSGDGVITLAWGAPDMSQAAPEASTENFEKATAWKSEVSGWKFLDLDRATIGGIGKKQLPVSGQQSFFTIDDNHSELNYTNDGDRFKAHSGHKCLWSMYSMRGNTYVQSDDWAISPELYGGPQTVSLWASSFKSDAGQPQYLETFEVLASSTGTEPADFVSVGRVDAVPAQWTKYEFYLPEGTTHMAIHGDSYDKYILMIDDVEMILAGGEPRQLSLTGYNIYRDGVRLNAEPLAATTYADTDVAPDKTYRYRVTALYGTAGESVGSDEVEGALSSFLAGVEDGSSVKVFARDGQIVIRGAEGKTATISSADGKVVASTVVANETRVTVLPGIYLVTVGHQTFKVLNR